MKTVQEVLREMDTELKGKQQITLSEIKREPETDVFREIEAAMQRPPVFDDDCPKMTDAQLAQFRRIAKNGQPE